MKMTTYGNRDEAHSDGAVADDISDRIHVAYSAADLSLDHDFFIESVEDVIELSKRWTINYDLIPAEPYDQWLIVGEHRLSEGKKLAW